MLYEGLISSKIKDEGIYTEVHISFLVNALLPYFKVKTGHKCTIPGKLADYCDRATFLTHSLFKSKQTALQICVYYDDVEVCNPLSSRRGKHKLGI